jgi:hypothetical protein
MNNETTERTDRFELFAAVLLGLAAITTALASFEAGLWDGKMIEGYGRANKTATAAASEQSRAVVEMSKDASIDVTAMRLILEADNASPATKELNYEIATYLYTKQMSNEGYKALGLPPEAKKEDTQSQTEEEAAAKQATLKEEILEKALEKDLADDENYRKEMLAKSQVQTEESEKTFKEGVDANEYGDKFELANVIFAISLFFSGISLVMKTNIRWALLGVGGVFWLCGAIYIVFVPWTFS